MASRTDRGRIAKAEPIPISSESARRLAVWNQHLAGKVPSKVTGGAIVGAMRDTAFIQWDPVSIVAPSHLIALWARVGRFSPSLLERLLWREKKLIEHWIPIAALVLTEDYPLYSSMMRRYPDSLSSSWGAQREEARTFLAQHAVLRRRIVTALREGPLRLGDFADHLRTPRDDGEWNPGSDVSLMLAYLEMAGQVMVVGHEGSQNLWGLADRFLPPWTDRVEIAPDEFERRAAQRALRALGTATPTEIRYHFPRGCYLRLEATLSDLERESIIHRVAIEGLGPKDERYILDRDLPLLDRVGGGEWEPRMSLLPPFDNLIWPPMRLEELFGFHYVREQFLPPARRRYGTYVLPILWGDRFIGRIDPRLDKVTGTLHIQSVHAEPDAPRTSAVGDLVRATIGRLAECIGARRLRFAPRVPKFWRTALS